MEEGIQRGQKPTRSLLPSMLSLLAKAQRRGQRDKETNTIECLLYTRQALYRTSSH